MAITKPFTPNKLPPNIDYAELVVRLTKAHAALARLDATVERLPNPQILERSFTTQEAVQSSKIEGTQATLEEVLGYEAEDGGADLTENKRGDIHEVINYRKALESGIKHIDQGNAITENFVKKLHGILLQSARGKDKAPGEFRKTPVHIGPLGAPVEKATYVPPSAGQIQQLFTNLEKYLNTQSEKDPLVQIGVSHYQFEAIHPFLDGNGRVGRLLIILFLYKHKLLKKPWLYLSEYFELHRENYYDLLLAVSEKQAWSEWLEFFLRAIEDQSTEACKTVEKILGLYEFVKQEALAMQSQYAPNMVEAIFISPIFNRRMMQELSGIENYQTASSLVQKFIEAGIIVDARPERKRNKVYAFPALIKLVN